MKKLLILLTVSLFATIALQAQEKQTKLFTELSIGPSFPIGRFAATSTNSGDKVAGYAKPGLGAQLSAGYHLNNPFGLLVSVGYATHPQNKQARTEDLKRQGIKVNQLN